MSRIRIFCLILMIKTFLMPEILPAASTAANGAYTIECFVTVSLGLSAEGNELFMRNMLISPELLGTFAPSRFESGPGGLWREAISYSRACVSSSLEPGSLAGHRDRRGSSP
jgi:hypothetical protein